jgi:trans-aconitate 2-methyltransferase
MIDKARQNYPHVQFIVADATNFQVEQPFDAIFSNAVLHWIQDPDAVIAGVQTALKPGGRFVVEFGGKGNVKAIVEALVHVLSELGYATSNMPWYFPSVAEYATRLEQQGFEVVYGNLFARPTPLEGKEAGMANWLAMFTPALLSKLPEEQQAEAIRYIEDRLRPTLYQDGTWMVDYRRIQVVAHKTERGDLRESL